MENWDFILSLIQTYGYWVVFLGILVECTGFPFPGETVLLIGSIAAAQGHMNIVVVIFLAATAAILGDNFGYWIGRKLGRDFLFGKLQKWKIMKAHEIKKAEKTFLKYGSATIFIGRFTPLLRIYAALLAGIFEIPYKIFFTLNVIGGIAWATLMGSLGYTLGRNVGHLTQAVNNIQILGVILVIAPFAWWLIKKYFRRWRRGYRWLQVKPHKGFALRSMPAEVREIVEEIRSEVVYL
jgi:membrane protein DedA with SNARE-associated domain